MTFLSIFSVIADLDGLDLIVASLPSPASETATAVFGGTTRLSYWKVQNRRSQFAFSAALTGESEAAGTGGRAAFSF
jgi:hypothetical protein